MEWMVVVVTPLSVSASGSVLLTEDALMNGLAL